VDARRLDLFATSDTPADVRVVFSCPTTLDAAAATMFRLIGVH